jgi:hypothetical protein
LATLKRTGLTGTNEARDGSCDTILNKLRWVTAHNRKPIRQNNDGSTGDPTRRSYAAFLGWSASSIVPTFSHVSQAWAPGQIPTTSLPSQIMCRWDRPCWQRTWALQCGQITVVVINFSLAFLLRLSETSRLPVPTE